MTSFEEIVYWYDAEHYIAANHSNIYNILVLIVMLQCSEKLELCVAFCPNYVLDNLKTCNNVHSCNNIIYTGVFTNCNIDRLTRYI